MTQVGFESTIPVFERTKTVHTLDCAATVIGSLSIYLNNTIYFSIWTTDIKKKDSWNSTVAMFTAV
jgi:hypothetical protein